MKSKLMANVFDLVMMEMALRTERYSSLEDLDRMHAEMNQNKKTYFGPPQDWAGFEEPETLEGSEEALANFIREVRFPTGPEARAHLATVTWCNYFFKDGGRSQTPLCDAILDRYIRVAELLYYNIEDKAFVKYVGLKLHHAQGIDMRRAVFYTFSHLFSKLRDANGDDVGWLRYIWKIGLEKGWDGVGEWRF